VLVKNRDFAVQDDGPRRQVDDGLGDSAEPSRKVLSVAVPEGYLGTFLDSQYAVAVVLLLVDQPGRWKGVLSSLRSMGEKGAEALATIVTHEGIVCGRARRCHLPPSERYLELDLIAHCLKPISPMFWKVYPPRLLIGLGDLLCCLWTE